MKNNLFKIKQIALITIIIVVIVTTVMAICPKKDKVTIPDENTGINTEVQNPIDEKLFVEKYIKDNIKTIATDEPVLGGSWYVVSVVVTEATSAGEVVYEDGHIQSKANFTYTYDKNSQNVKITKWEIVK